MKRGLCKRIKDEIVHENYSGSISLKTLFFHSFFVSFLTFSQTTQNQGSLSYTLKINKSDNNRE